ncbi:MAG: hypothetical protein AAFX56_08835 [Pseudomonadota bacterium]
MSTTRDKWHHRWFGVWREYGEAYRECPSIENFICPGASTGQDKKRIAHYLDTAHLIATTSRIQFPCAISGHRFFGSVSYRTDGQWLWLDDLSHYVIEHGVCIPPEMMEHMRTYHFEPPEVTEKQIEKLDWPAVGKL